MTEEEEREQFYAGQPRDHARVEVPAPPWTADAEHAAREETARMITAGHGRSSPLTIRAAQTAALDIERAWEAEHGAWAEVWEQHAPGRAERWS